MLVEDIVAAIEKIASPAAQADWDVSGFQIASARKEHSAMAVCLDATPDVVSEALRQGADFILSHHPLVLRPRLPARLDAYREVLRLLLSNDVPLYAAHTSLDVNLKGPAGWLGRELRLRDGTVLEETGNANFGFGEAGNLEYPMPVERLAEWVIDLAGLEFAVMCGPEPASPISRIAYCAGSGASLMEAARRHGAQVFITGDIKHHAALDAEIAIMDVGHHSLEEEMMKRFADYLRAELAGLKIIFVQSSSPFRIFAPGKIRKR